MVVEKYTAAHRLVEKCAAAIAVIILPVFLPPAVPSAWAQRRAAAQHSLFFGAPCGFEKTVPCAALMRHIVVCLNARSLHSTPIARGFGFSLTKVYHTNHVKWIIIAENEVREQEWAARIQGVGSRISPSGCCKWEEAYLPNTLLIRTQYALFPWCVCNTHLIRR